MSPWNCPFSTFVFDFYSIAHYITTSLFSKACLHGGGGPQVTRLGGVTRLSI